MCTPVFIAALFTIAKTWKQATQVSINRRMDKEDMIHIYSEVLLSHKKTEMMPFPARWMELEIIIHKRSKSIEDKYHMISLVYEI